MHIDIYSEKQRCFNLFFLLTCLFHDSFKWCFHFHQKLGTHLLKLAPDKSEHHNHNIAIHSQNYWTHTERRSPNAEYNPLENQTWMKTNRDVRYMIISFLIVLYESTHLLWHYLFILPETSMSFMKHSMLSGSSEELALMSFFSFSHSW